MREVLSQSVSQSASQSVSQPTRSSCTVGIASQTHPVSPPLEAGPLLEVGLEERVREVLGEVGEEHVAACGLR